MIETRISSRSSEAGHVLVTALLAVAILAILAAAAAGSATGALRAGAFRREDLAAAYLAESGLHHALALLRTGARPVHLDAPAGLFPPGDGYAVDLTYPEPRLADAAASGARGARSRRVRGRFHLEGLPPSYFADRKPTPPDGIVTGLCAPGDGPPVPFPPPASRQPPAQVPDGGDLTLSSGTTRLGPGAHAFRRVRLKKTAALSLTGPAVLYVRQGLSLEDGARLETTGAVTVYVEEDLSVTGGAAVVMGGPANIFIGRGTSWDQDARLTASGPVDLVLLAPRQGNQPSLSAAGRASLGEGPGDQIRLAVFLADGTSHGPVELRDQARLRGGLYAPGADVSLADGVTVRGSLVGCTVTGAGGGRGGDGDKGGGKDGGGRGKGDGDGGKGDGDGKDGGGGEGGGAEVTYDLGQPGAVPERGWYR